MDPELDIQVAEVRPGTAVVSVRGELDLAGAPQLKWALIDLPAAGQMQVVIDLTQVTFIDSTALSVIVATRRAFASLVLVTRQPVVLRVLEATGLDTGFRVFESVSAALAELHLVPAGA